LYGNEAVIVGSSVLIYRRQETGNLHCANDNYAASVTKFVR
jgi:hypothetical protein